MSGSDARALSRSLLDLCRMRKLTIATAESCTGGLVAGALTDIPGSSDVIDRGFVTYSNDAKRAMLGVKATTLATFGAVSKETATAMAVGALEKAGVDLAVSITGIAGPGGATPGKPVGLVHFAVASRDGKILHREFRFGAIGRTTVRQRSVVEALRMLMELARGPQPPVKAAARDDEPAASPGGANAAAQRRQAAPADADLSVNQPCAANALARVSLSEAAGVKASGLIESSMMAGSPLATASSKARAKSSVRSTWAPKPPQARASAAKSGLARSVPETRPGYSRS